METLELPIKKKNSNFCLFCENKIEGRIDKKYCSEDCRAAFHNRMRAKGNQSPLVRNITNALLLNRKILESLLPANHDGIKVSRQRLIQEGFKFKYLTHIHQTNNGREFYYCFDYGYIALYPHGERHPQSQDNQ